MGGEQPVVVVVFHTTTTTTHVPHWLGCPVGFRVLSRQSPLLRPTWTQRPTTGLSSSSSGNYYWPLLPTCHSTAHTSLTPPLFASTHRSHPRGVQ